jgi:hypothetical protein
MTASQRFTLLECTCLGRGGGVSLGDSIAGEAFGGVFGSSQKQPFFALLLPFAQAQPRFFTPAGGREGRVSEKRCWAVLCLKVPLKYQPREFFSRGYFLTIACTIKFASASVSHFPKTIVCEP